MDKNKISSFLQKMQFNFKDIDDLKPNEKKNFNFMKYIDDKSVHDFNPRRYNFYMQFIEALNNPETLKNVLYSNTLIKSKKEIEMESIRKIVNGLQSLYLTKDKIKDESNDQYLNRKKNKINKINTNVINRINNIISNDVGDNNNNIQNIINNTFKSPKDTKGGAGDYESVLQNNTDNNIIGLFYNKMIGDITHITNNLKFIKSKKNRIIKYLEHKKTEKKDTIDGETAEILKDLKNSNLPNDAISLSILTNSTGMGDVNSSSLNKDLRYPLKNFINDVSDITGDKKLSVPPIEEHIQGEKQGFKNDKKKGGMILEDSQYQRLNDIVFDIENDIMRPISKLDISREDRIIFIIVTFLIRFISLSFIDWSMNTNFISNFENAFSFYCLIYIVLFGLITMIVNVIYNYPLQQLYTDRSIVNIQSMLYYFYIYTNGPYRLILHIMFIIILMLIPFIIKVTNNQNNNPNFDYVQKKNTRKSLSVFTFIIWIITSIIAMRY